MGGFNLEKGSEFTGFGPWVSINFSGRSGSPTLNFIWTVIEFIGLLKC